MHVGERSGLFVEMSICSVGGSRARFLFENLHLFPGKQGIIV